MTSLAPRLVADIGGTNARFGWQRAPGAPIDFVQTLAVKAHADLTAAVDH